MRLPLIVPPPPFSPFFPSKIRTALRFLYKTQCRPEP